MSAVQKVIPDDLLGMVTMKTMATGEMRCRLKVPPTLDTKTKAMHLTRANSRTWQGQFHCHRKQTETYLVVAGMVAAVSWYGAGHRPTYEVVGPGGTVTFSPGVWHDIFTTIGAEFVTIQVAEDGVSVDGDREVMELPALVQAVMWQAEKAADSGTLDID